MTSVALGREPDADQRVDANLRHAVRRLEGDLPVLAPIVALSAERLAEWLASDLSQLDPDHPDRVVAKLRRSLACITSIGNMTGTVRASGAT